MSFKRPTKEAMEHRAWLRRASSELPVDPHIPVIDTHHHLWLDSKGVFPFSGRYMFDEVAEDVKACGHEVLATVYAQTGLGGWRRAEGPDHLRVVGESEFAQGVAVMAESGKLGKTRFCAGIFSTIDLNLDTGKVEECILAHKRAARNFRGFRCLGQIAWGSKKVRDSLKCIARHGLSLDVLGPMSFPMDFKVLSEVEAVARDIPNLVIVVNHCGASVGPRCFEERPSARAEWERHLRALEKHPNVFMKVSGLQMPACGFPIGPDRQPRPVTSDELAKLTFPIYGFCLKLFGAERCMAASNFPPDSWGCTYSSVWNCLKKVANRAGLSDREKHAFFHGTAERVYRLELPSKL